ncbi:MAG: hypothetical protein JW849_08990 [Phycisphaerae bacterium]|nr:hypothetical protein [Phycisphaerae bacterium]
MLFIFLTSFYLLPLGCSTSPQPRVIAERVFEGNRLEAIVTTFPGEPADLAVESCTVPDGPAASVEIERIKIEGRPGWRLRCGAPAGEDQLTLRAVVRHAGRRFEITIPFHRRDAFVARQGRVVIRWTAGRERLADLGPDTAKKPS